MTSSAFDLLIARAVILWPWRVDEQHLDVDPHKHRHEFDLHLRAAFAADASFISLTDIHAALESFLRRRPGPVNWYEALFDATGIDIDWRHGLPVLPVSKVQQWTMLCNDFEPDALLTFDLARRRIAPDGASPLMVHLTGWRTLARATDHELDVLWRRGLSDMHVHVGGSRIPQSAWLDILRSDRAGIAYTSLPDCYKDIGRSFKDDMVAARASRRRLTKHIFGAAETPPRQTPSQKQWWSWHHGSLDRERELLWRAWCLLIETPSASQQLDLELDRYLGQKHRFFSRTRQKAFDTNPGLRYFIERHFRALQRKTGGKEDKLRGAAYGSSRRLKMAPYGDACRYLVESDTLTRIELRIAPFDRAAEYWKFFRNWNRLKHQLDGELRRLKHRPVDVRFAVHFKRTRGPVGRRSRPHTISRLAELDKQSAALRVALSCAVRGPDLHALERIDVAGEERDTSLALFARHLRLLRDDPKAIRALEGDAFPPPWSLHMAAWKRLQHRGLHRWLSTRKCLGITVHAGEDFADPLDGLYQIASALDVCELRAGDGIGHGLALVPAVSADRRQPDYSTISIGEAVDQLCWLHTVAEKFVPATEVWATRAHLREMIASTGKELFDRFGGFAHLIDARDLIWLWEVKSGRRAGWQSEAKTAPRLDLIAALSSDAFWFEHDRFESIPSRQSLEPVVKSARNWMLDRVIESRVVVEMNPSSNLRITGSESTETNPTVALLRAMKKGLLACVNTDNPGVFVTCIENEFGLLLDGLSKQRDVSVKETRELLEAARNVGMEILR